MTPVRMYGVFDSGIDGRAPSVLKAVCELEGHAAVVAGPYRHVSPVWAIPLGDGRCYVLERPEAVILGVDFDQQRKDARAAALAKLSPEDRRALGVGDE